MDSLYIYLELKKLLKKECNKLMSQFTDNLAAATAEIARTNASLDNITTDIDNLDKMIQDLKDQLNSGQSVLTAEDAASFNSFVATVSALATKSKTIADKTADPPPPPPQQSLELKPEAVMTISSKG